MNARTSTIAALNGRTAAIAIVISMLLLSVFGGVAVGQSDAELISPAVAVAQ